MREDVYYRDLLCRLFQTGPVALGFGRDYTPNPMPDVASKPKAPATLGRGGSATDRRGALKLGGQVTLGATVSAGLGAGFTDAAADAMEFTQRAEASAVGPRTLEHLELAVAGMAATFTYTPPAELFPHARWYRGKVASLIDGAHTLRQGRDLYRQAGWLSVLLAWLSHDLGDTMAADAYCLDAYEHGWQAEDNTICAWAMDVTATVAREGHRPAAARDAGLKGLHHAPEGSAAAVRVSAQLARAYAQAGADDHCAETLRATQARLDRLDDPGSGLFAVDAGRVACYTASSYVMLGRPTEAVPHAKEAIAFYREVDPEGRCPTREALARLDLAMTHVELGAPEDAAQEIHTALTSERLTGSVVSRLRRLADTMHRKYPELDMTRAVHEQSTVLAASLSRPGLSSA